MQPFQYFAPETVAEALDLMERLGSDAKLLAGGQSLIPVMKMGLAEPRYIVDLKRIGQLDYIRGEGSSIKIGGLTRYHEIEHSPLIMERCNILSQTIRQVGHPQIRNRGTIGGSISHFDPGADLPPTLVALGSGFLLTSKKRERSVNAEDFFLSPFTTSLQPGEILTEVEVPMLGDYTKGNYLKLSFGPGDFSIVSVASLVTFDEDAKCVSARIVLGGVGDRPIRAKASEQALMSYPLTDEIIERASKEATKDVNPPSDLKASGEYRLRMISVLTKRSLRQLTHG